MAIPKLKQHVIVGLSGGVDSAVAAFLLKEQGFNVSAIFMRNWEPKTNDPYCTIDQDLRDAEDISKHLSLPLEVVNFSEEYWDRVFRNFLDEYAAGRTPNPDVLCNKEIKFKAFLEYAKEQGADLIATGHYARNVYRDSQWHLLKGLDKSKDQSYFLYTLGQEQLRHSLFPLGELEKSNVREIARRAGIPNYAKKDSTGICFIGERKFKEFLAEYLLAKPGVILTSEGEKMGTHDGLMFYTLGQRQGLGLGGKKDAKEAPWYVVNKDIAKNILVVSQDSNDPILMSKNLSCEKLHWVLGEKPREKGCFAKIRYRQSDQECRVTMQNDGSCDVEFIHEQRAITPGQSVVFYDQEKCLGGGIISKTK